MFLENSPHNFTHLFWKDNDGLGTNLPSTEFSLTPELLTQLVQIMMDYNTGKINHQTVIQYLVQYSNDGRNFHFNLNTDIQRLLLCRYPYKIVLSTPRDVWANNPNRETTDFTTVGNIKISFGTMSKGEEYEAYKLMALRKNIREVIGEKDIIGTFGQLSFYSEETKASVQQLFSVLAHELDLEKHAILCSGSLLGAGALSYYEASKKGLKTIGIFPHSIAHIVDRSKFSCVIIEGDDWGDASFIFGGLPSRIFFAGGGYWSYLEYEKAQKFGTMVIFLNFPQAQYCKEFEDGKPKTMFSNTNIEEFRKYLKAFL